ncbi:N-acetylmuramoyl-L-alanine amidase [Streptomyces sp. MUSC 125]|uniref:N-acetylmuramoyl-L-alanine amidase n=1 Tax=unclassified Streptomyces TaxID=2593676 RepID=UPI0005826862|nr:N-acetylmuramoyl-L-alanine amidase [Streptomyces sp. MUSC 125]MCH0559988.1 N-acetylmuramoyl-L-alanine amidase [Streptomyces sp. MUM 16J]
MSYTGPDFDPPQRPPSSRLRSNKGYPRRPRRGPLTVALAALVPGALLGWVVYEAVGDGGSGGSGRTASPASPASASASASRTAAAPSSPLAPSAPSPRPTSPGDGGKRRTTPPTAGTGSGPLRGKVVVIDPGHNPGNFHHTAEINRKVNIGTNWKECDTTGTSTNGGYTEARFTLDVARRLRTLLEEQGATVKFTHDGNSPAWGPCVDERARIGDDAHADAAVSIHADGSVEGNRGFHVILPGAVHSGAADTRPIVDPSRDLGARIAGNFLRDTGEPPSNYLGKGTGLVTRTDLGGLNLSTVPKVFIECGNMRDSKDATLLTSGAWRQKAAQGIADGIVGFLRAS